MMNVMMGFEEANRYVIMDPQGNHVGFMAEQDLGIGRTVGRQLLGTRRSFVTHVFDKHEKEVLRFYRPFSWINSRIHVYDPLEVATASLSSSKDMQGSTPGSPTSQVDARSAKISSLRREDMRLIGEAQQQWAPLRRKYNLFLSREDSAEVDWEQLGPPEAHQKSPTKDVSGLPALDSSSSLQTTSSSTPNASTHLNQFAYVDEPFLSWDFSLLGSTSSLIGSVNRNWAGMGREIFTDTGVYALRMDSAGLASEPSHLISKTGDKAMKEGGTAEGMTLDQRAVMLATAVSIDFDYFSRKRGGFMPLWFPFGGAGEAGAEAAGTAGAEGAGATGTGAGAGAGAGAIEGATSRGIGSTAEGASTFPGAAATGVGTMAGYEAMQRGSNNNQQKTQDSTSDSGSPDLIPGSQSGNQPNNGEWTMGSNSNSNSNSGSSPGPGPGPGPNEQIPPSQNEGEEVWGKDSDPWGGSSGGDSGGDGGGGGGWGDINDWFDS